MQPGFIKQLGISKCQYVYLQSLIKYRVCVQFAGLGCQGLHPEVSF